MITKERLQELIEQGATIYEVKYNNINPVSLTNKIRDVYYKNGVIAFEPRPDEKYLHHKYLKNLFETEEEAIWHKEFGCIERTEILELPTWEEFKRSREEYRFFHNENNYILTKEFCADMMVSAFYGSDVVILIINETNNEELFAKGFTKENYILACRKAKELFLGGKK